MVSYQGNPCWFELGTTDLDAAQRFYGDVLGWSVAGAGMEGFDYRLAKSGGEMVAGMMSTAGQKDAPGPNWVVYVAVDDCDATARAATEAGATVMMGPQDIPNTGRFAVIADPQGAVFGILQPDMSTMSDADRAKAEAGHGAFDQQKAGHGNWLELMSTDAAAGFEFYAGLFGWTKGTAMDMGSMGTYQLFARNGADIGGMMGLGNAPSPRWLTYFGVNGVAAGIERIRSGGGQVHRGPTEVPGGAFIAVASDPQGAPFAVVGPMDRTN